MSEPENEARVVLVGLGCSFGDARLALLRSLRSATRVFFSDGGKVIYMYYLLADNRLPCVEKGFALRALERQVEDFRLMIADYKFSEAQASAARQYPKPKLDNSRERAYQNNRQGRKGRGGYWKR